MSKKEASIAAIIPAAGKGKRFKSDIPKQFVEIKGKPILIWTIEALAKSKLIDRFFVVLPKDNFENWKELLEKFVSNLNIHISFVKGGSERWESVWNGLLSLPEECQWVVIHDGARPLVSTEVLKNVMAKAREVKAAICAYPSTDTVKNVKRDKICKTLDRTTIWLAQTPQIFWKDLILEAYREALSLNKYGTDDASFVEMIGYPVYVVEGDKKNIKITTKDDLEWFKWHISKR